MSNAEMPSGEASTTGGDEIAIFRRALFAQTRRAWVTPLLVGMNALIFAAMILTGVGIFSPTVDSLIRWGANYGPRTTSGQSWRLLSSMFVHVGVLHVGMNMIGLWQIGYLVERLLGNRAFLIVYFFSGVCGSLASVIWNPFVVSAGASGAVFGVYGALMAYLIRHRGSIPREVLRSLQRSSVFFVVLNLVYGFQIKGIDMAAHTGGIIGGFLGALLIARPLALTRLPQARRAPWRELVLVAVGVMLVLVVPRALPRAVDLQAEMAAFVAMERTAIETYNGALDRRRTDPLADVEIARVIDDQVLPPWRRYQRRVDGWGRLPPAQKERVDDLARYLALRERGWSRFSEALRSHDRTKADEAGALLKEAEGALKEKPAPGK